MARASGAGGGDRRHERERRAEDAMSAIQQGANPAEEAFRLASAFSEEQEGRLAAWWRRRRSKPAAEDAPSDDPAP
jgi:cytochrome c553